MAANDIVHLCVAMILVGFGCLGNMFILLVFLKEYRRSKTLQPSEVIVTLMSVCCIVTELCYALWFPVYMLNFCSYFGDTVYKVTDFINIFLPKTITWLTAWLCFVYCVKIIKVNWRFFMRLKQRISLVVRYMIVGTLLLCILLGFPIILLIELKVNTTNICRDYYSVNEKKELSLIFSSMLSVLTSFLPLVLMLVSSLSIVIFLCRHSRNMDKNMASSRTSHSDAHTSVAIMLICLIALFVACAGTVLSVDIQVASGQFDVKAVITLVDIIYSSGSPVILIIGMVKLRNSFVKLLCPIQRK
ncbi:taste receptor type 2 member 1-like [Latimeria chalumnae]|uniref:taste receptor type 2 member 1-like n=1 Tax=Latimeria chalumnae TaxID=7897 RepID=UPI0003C18BBB|nr:PREDICTED: taste receptor type 2 member 1-like [Latimeria chalumnae]|eukprot:XP_006012361.1 PREDICTED: taste receptor type 2 member 1-like [Latimeria chalumnae]